MSHITKDPDAKLPYPIDWSEWLEALAPGETIASSLWVVPSGISKVSDAHSDTVTSILLEGGEAGQDYILTNRITTALGYIDDRSITVHCRER